MLAAGIDAGTQSVKVLVYDSDEKSVKALVSEPIAIIERDGGVREQEAAWWIDAVVRCFSRIDEGIRRRISVISVSGQQHGFVPLSAAGEVLCSAKLWCDTSTSLECREIEEALGGRKALSSRIGNPILPGYTASKIRALHKTRPDLYDRLGTVLLPHDYIDFFLTGERVMERGDASGTGLMDIFSGSWDEEAVEATAPGLMGKLPPILESPGIIGKATASAAEALGLPDGVKVASGGGDNMMSAIGTGAVEDGVIAMSLGTSGTLFSTSSRPFCDSGLRLASFCSSTGAWLPLLCTMNCTVASETMRNLFDRDVKAFDGMAQKAGAGAGGLLLLPFLNGERVPDFPNGEGVLFGMHPSNVTQENIARATLEGVTYGFMLGLEAFRDNGVDPKSLILTGGGAKSRVWRSLVADMTRLSVKVPSMKESAAFGAALHGIWCLSGGDIEDIVSEHVGYDPELSAQPDEGKMEIYREGYGRWLRCCEALSPIFR